MCHCDHPPCPRTDINLPHSGGVFNIYQAFMRFQEMFLNDHIWGVRTENPWEANMFYLPAFAYYSCCKYPIRFH